VPRQRRPSQNRNFVKRRRRKDARVSI